MDHRAQTEEDSSSVIPFHSTSRRLRLTVASQGTWTAYHTCRPSLCHLCLLTVMCLSFFIFLHPACQGHRFPQRCALHSWGFFLPVVFRGPKFIDFCMYTILAPSRRTGNAVITGSYDVRCCNPPHCWRSPKPMSLNIRDSQAVLWSGFHQVSVKNLAFFAAQLRSESLDCKAPGLRET